MSTIALTGMITESGTLEAKLPSGLPPGEVRLLLELPEDAPISPEELGALLKVEPLPGSEMVKAGLTGCWKDQQIQDGQLWLEERRAEQRRTTGW